MSLIRLAGAYSLVYDCLNCPLSTVSVVGPKLRYAYICNEVVFGFAMHTIVHRRFSFAKAEFNDTCA